MGLDVIERNRLGFFFWELMNPSPGGRPRGKYHDAAARQPQQIGLYSKLARGIHPIAEWRFGIVAGWIRTGLVTGGAGGRLAKPQVFYVSSSYVANVAPANQAGAFRGLAD